MMSKWYNNTYLYSWKIARFAHWGRAHWVTDWNPQPVAFYSKMDKSLDSRK